MKEEQKKYDITNLYFCGYAVLGRPKSGVVYQNNGSNSFTNIFHDKKTGQLDLIKPNQIVYMASFAEELASEELSGLIGKSKELTPGQIQSIMSTIRNKKHLKKTEEINYIKSVSQRTALIISDLLGINISIKPQSDIRLRVPENVAVVGKKVEKFIRILTELIEIYWYKNYNSENQEMVFELTSDPDNIIFQALNKSGISVTEKLTSKNFKVVITKKQIIINQDQDIIRIPYRGKTLIKLPISLNNTQKIA